MNIKHPLRLLALSLLLLSLAVIGWLSGTQHGLQWLNQRLANGIPGLTIDRLEGRIIGPLSLSGLQYHSEKVDLTIEHIDLNWAPTTLLTKTLTIKKLGIHGIEIKQHSANTAPDKTTTILSLKQLIEALKLPIALEVDQLIVTKGKLYRDGQQQAQASTQVKTLSLSGRFDEGTLSLKQVTFDSNSAKLQGSIEIPLSSQKAAMGHLSWSLQPQNAAAIQGKTTLQGPLNQLELLSALSAPYQLSINSAITIPDKAINQPLSQSATITSKATFTALELNKINANWPAKILQGTAGLSWKKSVLALTGDLREQASSTAKNTSQLQWDASLNTATEPSITLKANWQNIHWPTRTGQQAPLSSPKGSAQLTGSYQAYRLAVNAELNGYKKGGKQQGHFNLAAKGKQQSLALSTLSLTGPLGQLDGSGQLTLGPQLATKLQLSGKQFNPGALFPGWPGAIDLSININTRKGPSPLTTMAIQAAGQLRKHPITVEAQADYGNQGVSLESLKLISANSKVTVNGSINIQKQLSLNWSIDSKDLAELLPNTSGSLNSTGEFQGLLSPGQLSQARIKAEVAATAIKSDKFSLKKLHFNSDIDWRPHPQVSRNDIQLNATQVTIDSMTLESLTLNGKGTAKQHQLHIDTTSAGHQLQAKLSGKIQQYRHNTDWQLALNQATLSLADMAPWRLQQTAHIAIGRHQQTITQHCWQQAQAQVCLRGKHQNDQLDTSFSIHQVPTSSLSPLLPEGLVWSGSTINGQGHLTLPASQPLNAAIELSSSPGRLSWVMPTNRQTPPPSLSLQEGQLSLTANHSQLSAKLTLPFQQATGIAGSLSIKSDSRPLTEREISGALQFQLDDLAPFAGLIPNSSDLQGQLAGQWDLGGSLNQPQLHGQLTLSDGQLRLHDPGIFLQAMELQMTGKPLQGLDYTVSAQSGPGHLTIDGSANLTKSAAQFSFTVTGENAQVFSTEDAKINASPNLKVSASQENIDISGDLLIPYASITPAERSQSAITPSNDQIIISKANQTAQPLNKRKINANIKLSLGDNVSIDGFGFKGLATGSIQLSKRPQESTLGKGEIRISEGEYRAFGQGLVIETGNILFSGGPISKPGIDIKAQRQPAEDITVGVFARGSISQPEVTVFSEPAMGKSEQLSWLMLGRPLEQSSSGESNAINQLLLSLTLSQSNLLLNRFQGSLNLDTLNIKTGSGEAGAASDNDLAELVLGKYLSPDLYVSYGIGLFKPVNVLSLEYSLGRHWKLTSETSSETSGGDIVYTIEK